MAIRAFQCTLWIGWLTGTIFINKPWGRLKYSWLSFYTFYAVLYNFSTIIIWGTFTFKAIEFLQCKSLTSKILNFTLLLGSLLFGAILKIFFFTQAKNIAKFVDYLFECVDADNYSGPELQSLWKKCKIFLSLISLYQFGGAFMLPIQVWFMVPNAALGFITSPFYNMVLFLFAVFPTMACIQVSFVYLIVSTFYILTLYEKFFVDLQELVNIKTASGNTALSIQLNDNILPIPLDSSLLAVPTKTGIRHKVLSKEEIVARMKKIKNLCVQYDASVSPLFLVLLVRCVFSLIHAADAILFESTDTHDNFMMFKKYFAWMHIFVEISHLCLIFVGSIFHQRIAGYKEQFAERVFVLEQSEAKNELQEIWELVRDWKWQVTAWGIFTVDKPVFAGVVSCMMTYVVILFQVNLSDPGVPPNSNCTVPKYL